MSHLRFAELPNHSTGLSSRIQIDWIVAPWTSRPTLRGSAHEGVSRSRNRLDGIKAALSRLAATAEPELFEEGMESGLSRGVEELFASDARELVSAVADHLGGELLSTPVLVEVLRGISRSRGLASLRRSLFEEALKHRDASVRDVAVTGLSLIADRTSLRALRAALDRESVPELRRDLTSVLAEL